MAEVTNNFKTK